MTLLKLRSEERYMSFIVMVKHGVGWLRFGYSDKRDQQRHADQWRKRGYTVKTDEVATA